MSGWVELVSAVEMVKWCRRLRSAIASRGGAGGLRRCLASAHAGSAPGKSVGHGKRMVCVKLQLHEAEAFCFGSERAVIANCEESWRKIEAGELLEESESSGVRAV